MTKLELISYEESRLAFFEQQLAGANRKLDWAIKHKSHWDCAEKGEIVSFYQDIVKMLREQAEREKGCEYCKFPSGYLAAIENAEPRILLTINGSYLQIFDEDYPGFIDNVEINYCPMCGKKLKGADE